MDGCCCGRCSVCSANINMVVSSAAQRRLAEKQFEADRLSFQYGMNDAVMKELEIRQEMNRLSFSTDWSQDMRDAQERLTQAAKDYESSLNDIYKVQAKIGQRNKIDWGKTASSTLSGVAAGAVIGSAVFPVIGTAVGAIVGGVIGFVSGLFGGKKKKDVWGGVLQEYPELLMQTADGVKVVNIELAKQLIALILLMKRKVILQNIIDQAEEYKRL